MPYKHLFTITLSITCLIISCSTEKNMPQFERELIALNTGLIIDATTGETVHQLPQLNSGYYNYGAKCIKQRLYLSYRAEQPAYPLAYTIAEYNTNTWTLERKTTLEHNHVNLTHAPQIYVSNDNQHLFLDHSLSGFKGGGRSQIMIFDLNSFSRLNHHYTIVGREEFLYDDAHNLYINFGYKFVILNKTNLTVIEQYKTSNWQHLMNTIDNNIIYSLDSNRFERKNILRKIDISHSKSEYLLTTIEDSLENDELLRYRLKREIGIMDNTLYIPTVKNSQIQIIKFDLPTKTIIDSPLILSAKVSQIAFSSLNSSAIIKYVKHYSSRDNRITEAQIVRLNLKTLEETILYTEDLWIGDSFQLIVC